MRNRFREHGLMWGVRAADENTTRERERGNSWNPSVSESVRRTTINQTLCPPASGIAVDRSHLT